jgi:hypothetical protein
MPAGSTPLPTVRQDLGAAGFSREGALVARRAEEHDKDDRLEAGTEVSRELWLLSGNECAFPQCGVRLLNEHDDWQGEIAHIHGVKKTAARYDSALSAEDKRAVENLLLLCPNHHGEVDGKNGRNCYSAADMKLMKRRHEDRFRRALAQVEQEIGDLTLANVVVPCTSLTATGSREMPTTSFRGSTPLLRSLADSPGQPASCSPGAWPRRSPWVSPRSPTVWGRPRSASWTSSRSCSASVSQPSTKASGPARWCC